MSAGPGRLRRAGRGRRCGRRPRWPRHRLPAAARSRPAARRLRRPTRRRPTSPARRPTPAPTAPATPAPPPTVTVGWSGDAVPASVDRGLPADPGRLLRAVTPLLRRPDVMVGNLEGTLTRVATSTKCAPGADDCVAFRSPPEYARLFADAGYDVLSLANNHSHDFGAAGLAETRRAVRGDRPGRHRRPGRDRRAHRPRHPGRGRRLRPVRLGGAAERPGRGPRAGRPGPPRRRTSWWSCSTAAPRAPERCTCRADGRSRSARTAATCAPSPGRRWRRGRTRCSAPARTWCAEQRWSTASRSRTRSATWSATARCRPRASPAPPRCCT